MPAARLEENQFRASGPKLEKWSQKWICPHCEEQGKMAQRLEKLPKNSQRMGSLAPDRWGQAVLNQIQYIPLEIMCFQR